MKSIYNLYLAYDDLQKLNYGTEKKNICIDEVDSCINLYTNLIKTCHDKDKGNFCTALSAFKDKYDKLKKIIPCITKDLPAFPSYQEEISLSASLDNTDREYISMQTEVSGLEDILLMENKKPPAKNNTYAII
ncbi:hypothetical protein PCYB_006100, partial [Plasmodium cynomolgi strain B]